MLVGAAVSWLSACHADIERAPVSHVASAAGGRQAPIDHPQTRPVTDGQSATSFCAAPAIVGRALWEAFRELPSYGGRIGDKRMRIYLSPSGSWSMVVFASPDVACVVAGGLGWRRFVRT